MCKKEKIINLISNLGYKVLGDEDDKIIFAKIFNLDYRYTILNVIIFDFELSHIDCQIHFNHIMIDFDNLYKVENVLDSIHRDKYLIEEYIAYYEANEENE